MSNQIKLSKRMQAVADFAGGDVVADIGCDHAFVSVYLILSRKAQKVIAMDVRQGPIDIAKKNVKLYGVSENIDVRASDGFQKLSEKEADCAIIAGMGGNLMLNILKEGLIHLENGIDLVLQPQSEQNLVREFLEEHSYKIVDEKMVYDEGKYYTIIKAKINSRLAPGEDSPAEYSEDERRKKLELLYGPCLMRDRSALFLEYIEKEARKKSDLINQLEKEQTVKARERKEELEKEYCELAALYDRK